MKCSKQQLLIDVMARLGEIARPQTVLVSPEVPWPEDIVALKAGSLLAEVGSKLIMECPEEKIGSGVPIEGEVTSRLMPCGLYAAEVRLPDDFLRLVSLKMSGWGRSVRYAIHPGAPDWGRQWSAERGIAGCPLRPMAYLDTDSAGILLRAIGSEDSAPSMEWLRGWRVPKSDSAGEFDFPGRLYPDLVSEIASRI